MHISLGHTEDTDRLYNTHNIGSMIHSNPIHVVTTSITEKVKYLHRDPLKIQTNVYIREVSSFFTVSAFINIFSTSGISELIQKNRWGR